MSGSDLVRKLRLSYEIGFDDGQHTGQQQGFDVGTIYLIRKGWTGKELVDYYKGCCDIIDEYAEAYNPAMEQDIAQERMDEELRAGYEDAVEFIPFRERYPSVKNMGYDRPIKEPRHPAAKKKRGKHK